MSYFQYVVSSLTFEEIEVLGILSDQEATAPFKALRREAIQKKTELSVARLRKVLNNLIATHFIMIVIGVKEHRIFITEYGQEALFTSLEEVDDV